MADDSHKSTTNSDENTYHANSYRVLLTRDRDGLVIFVKDDRFFDVIFFD